MNEDGIRTRVVRTLESVAPEATGKVLQPDANFRDQLDFDSLDFLNFVTALQREFKVQIPEMDYPKLSSLEGCAHYLARRLESAAQA